MTQPTLDRLTQSALLIQGAALLLESSSTEPVLAAKKPAREHDPLVNELAEILGGLVSQHTSAILEKNFPGTKMAELRQNIRIDTVRAFSKALKRHFNAHYDGLVAPERKAVEETVEKSTKQASETPSSAV